MIGATVRRGLAAGLIAGVLAGLLGLFVGEPALDAAIALEAPAPDDGGPAVSRPVQRVGLVVATALAGVAVGALFGVLSAWAVGRVAGDTWTRSLKLSAVAVAALVVLPLLAYPAGPPGVGDPSTVALRTRLYLATGLIGVVLAVLGWMAARRLARTSLDRPARQTLLGVGVALATAGVLAILPRVDDDMALPAELVWSFRLGSLAVQATLWGGTGVAFGLLAGRRERRRTAQRAG